MGFNIDKKFESYSFSRDFGFGSRCFYYENTLIWIKILEQVSKKYSNPDLKLLYVQDVHICELSLYINEHWTLLVGHTVWGHACGLVRISQMQSLPRLDKKNARWS